jgi:nucleoside-triphosphatase
MRTREKVGSYYVDVAGFEAIALPALTEALEGKEFIVIDEIGPMEERSKAFKGLLLDCLNSEKTVIATIKERGSSFVEELKRRKDARIFHVDQKNRDMIVKDILEAARSALEK